RPPTLKACLSKWSCWRETTNKNGRALYRHPIACATSTATRPFFWLRPWAASFANEFMKIRWKSPIKNGNQGEKLEKVKLFLMLRLFFFFGKTKSPLKRQSVVFLFPRF